MATATYPAPPPERHLPIGVGILAILIGIVGFLFVIAGVLLLLAVGVLATQFPLFGGGLIGTAILMLLGIVLLSVASGLWHLRLWALVLSIIVVVIGLVEEALSMSLLSIGGIILIVLLVYLVAVHREFT
jgi:hypothetical protein